MKKIKFMNKEKPKNIENTFATKNFLLVVISVVVLVLGAFLLLRFNYKEVFKIDIDGFMLSEQTIESLMDSDDETSGQKISVVKLKSNDAIYKNSFDHYVNDDRKKTVNVSYPLFVDNGFTIINYNSNVNLVDDKFERKLGYERLVLSYGHIYDGTDYTQVDQENYLFLSYQDGTFINLYDIKIETVTNKYVIPTNSFLFFFENKLNYFERKDNGFVRRSIIDLDRNSKFTFYYEGTNEKYEYLYEDIFTGIGNVYIEFEMPEFEDLAPGSQNTDLDKDGVDGDGSAVGEEGNGTSTGVDGWRKPTVTTSQLNPNVYSIEGTLYINDPSRAIVSAPTFTIYKDNKIYSRRSYYSGGNFVFTGLSSETEYFIIGQYTYLDSDGETQKMVTFYTGNLTTKDRSSLGKVNLTYKLGDIYSKKIVLNEVGITSSLQSEVLRGVYKAQLIINGKTYPVSTGLLQQMLSGSRVTLESSSSLKTNSKQEFEIEFYDRDNNLLEATNNTGETRTSKEEPIALLKQLESDNLHTKIQVELRNNDDASINDYKYSVIDSAGVVVFSEKITGKDFTLTDLDPNQLFTVKVTGDVDLDNNKGVINDYLLGEMGISTLPISNLGFVNLNVNKSNVTSASAEVSVGINLEKTDSMLLQLLKEIRVSLYNSETDEFIGTKRLNGSKVSSLLAGKKEVVSFEGLDSNTVYDIKVTSLVKQGRTEMELDCVYNLDQFKTRKKTAQALIINSFVANDMFDFDLLISDKDGAILSKEAVVEFRDDKQNIIDTQVVKTNNKDYVRITYNGLLEKHNYNLYIYANEYNETDVNSEYIAKYDLLQLTIYTDGGITGNIELVSSIRTSGGKNLVDVESGAKWIQTLHDNNVPSSLDSDGNMHIYSKNGSSAYTYDLSDYYGKMVTASFKIKAVAEVQNNYKVYFGNDIYGTTNSNRSIELSGLNDEWKSFTYTFVVGQEKIDSLVYRHVNDKTFGKNNASYAGFYITGGTAKLAEYVISDLQIAVVSDYSNFSYDNSVSNKSWNSNQTTTNTSKYASSNLITLDSGYYYEISTNSDYVNAFIWNKDGSFVKETGNISEALTLYANSDLKVVLQFRDETTNLGHPDIDASKVTFSIKRYKNGEAPSYEKYKYTLETKVKVDLVDVRGEITNRDYFIKVYENGKEVKSYNYVELKGVTKISNVIKKIELDENKDYVVELGVKIRDRYYSISSFEISTGSEVVGISTVEDWSRIQPYGNYIVLNNLDFKGYNEQTWSYGNRYFYGSIDFQGYSANIYTADDTFQRIGRLEKSAVLKNMVLNVYLNHESDTKDENGFVNTNYGLIENVYINIYDLTNGEYELTSYSSLCDTNQRSGIIRNFVVNVNDDVHVYSDSAILVRNNYGLIENGYIYGEGSLVPSPEVNSGEARDVSYIQKYGGSRSIVNKVFVLNSFKFLSEEGKPWDNGGLISYESYGQVNNSYVTGSVNISKLTNGPAVYMPLGNFSSNKLYYLSNYTYTNDYHQRVNATILNDSDFQKSVLGETFVVDEMVKLGYYPQVVFTSDMMPSQPYIALPEVIEDHLVDIISSEVVEQTNDSAVVEFDVSNPEGEEITEIVIADVTVEIVDQSFENGKSIVTANIINPTNYISKYQIRSIKSKLLTYESERIYSAGERYLEVSFYREIKDVDDWININERLNQNYAIMNDIDFYGYSNILIGNFTGKIEGNNHVLKNIDVVGSDGVFNQMNGILQNIKFENINKYTEADYVGIAGYSNKNAKYENVHVKNITLEVNEEKNTDNFFAGGLVGYLAGGMITNSSVTDVKIVSNIDVNNIAVGGLVGYASSATIMNSYAQDVNLEVVKSVGTYGVGGLVGREDSINGVIERSYATGTITNDNYYTGGIAGYSVGSIDKCYSSVNLNSNLGYVGGIVGYNKDTLKVNNNLYVGNIYSAKGNFGRISSVKANNTNYAYSDGLINGVISNSNNGESFVSYEQLLIDGIYKENVGLGEGFDYSKSSKGILPKLYYSDTEDLLPNQKDNELYKDKFKISNVVIDNKETYAEISLDIENPNNYLITELIIDNMDVEIINNDNVDGITHIKINATPNIYVDSYKLNKILYKEKIEDSDNLSFKKNYKFDVIFYRQIKDFADWQKISRDVAENYYLMTDIDFTDETDINTNVIFNRLETVNDEVHTLSGISIENNDNIDNVVVINKILTNIKNIKFNNIKITDSSNRTNNYVNVIGNVYGSSSNISFSDITIEAVNENYVSIIGRSYSDLMSDITLNNINVTGKNYVSSFISVLDNGLDKIYKNVNGTNLIVVGSEDYVGGLVAEMVNENIEEGYYITNFNVSDSSVTSNGNYVGGIVGIGEVNDSNISNTDVIGNNYVGGIVGYQQSSYMRNNKVDGSNITGLGHYIGGISGRSLSLKNSIVKNSTVKADEASSYGVGGITGLLEGYTLTGNGVLMTTVTGSGYGHGGVVGRMLNGTVSDSYVEDGTINGNKYIGGVVGEVVNGFVSTSHVTRTLVNSVGEVAGGIVGFMNNQAKVSGQIREVYVTDTDVVAEMYAGGFIGSLNNMIYGAEDKSYGLYFEGSVNSTTGNGLGTGDEYNKNILGLARVYAYEGAVVNGNKVASLAGSSMSDNLASNISLNNEKIVDEATGDVITHYLYPYGAVTDYISLAANKTYEFSVNTSGGSDWMRLYFYTSEDGKYISPSDSGNSSVYTGGHFSLEGMKTVKVKVLKDCKVRLVFRNMSEITDYSVREVVSGSGDLTKEQSLSYQNLRNKVTWTRYLDSNMYDFLHLTKLNYRYNAYDWSKLQYSLGQFVTFDSSDKGNDGVVNVTGVSKDGVIFDGIDDQISISDYQTTNEFSISANVTQYSSNEPYYQFIFNSGSYGIFIHNRYVYVRINGEDFVSGAIPLYEEVNITATYGSGKLKVYLDGVLRSEHDVNLDVVEGISSAMISPAYNDGIRNRRFVGAMRSISVFDRVLSDDEVMSNYSLDSIVNTIGLNLYYDFSNMKYDSGVGHYPTKIDVSTGENYEGQLPTELPTEENRDYNDVTNQNVGVKLVSSKLSDIYKVYASGVNTVNLEFDDIYNDVSFSYKYGDYVSDFVKADRRVYTLTYDFKSDLEITLRTLGDVKVIKLKANKLARKIYVDGDNYYHIDGKTLYRNDDKVISNIVNVYDGLALTTDYKIYDISSKKTLDSLLQTGILSKEVSLYESNVNGTSIKAYYNFSKVVDNNGNESIRDGQLVSRDGRLYVFSLSDSVKQDMNLFNTYNTDEYQVSLVDGSLVALKNKLKYPGYFNNSDIVEVSFDKNSDQTIMFIRYSNDYVYAFDYYNGDELYSYGTKMSTSLFKFIFEGFSSDDNLASSNETYGESKNLLKELDKLTNQDVIDKLNPGMNDSDNEEVSKPITGSNEGTNYNEKVDSQYIQVYNYETNSYHVYSVSELLNSEKEEISSETDKINNDTFLYNYFYNKTNTMDNIVKVIIFVVIIGIILVNLVVFARYLSRKEVKNNG